MNIHRSVRMWDKWAKEQGFPSINTYLYSQYIDKGLSLEKLGLQMEIRRARVAQMLRRYDIPVRSRGGVR